MTITLMIIVICIAVYAMVQIKKREADTLDLAIKYGALYIPRVEIKHEYWRFLTSNFIHVEFVHLFMNCYALYYLGSFFESLLRPLPYIYLILMACLGSSLVTYGYTLYTHKNENTVALGASGIFYGLLGAMIVLGLVYQGPFLIILKNNLLVIAVNVAYTLLDHQVSKTGHLGGLLGGILAMIILIGAGVCGY